jgi:hypothetical protein
VSALALEPLGHDPLAARLARALGPRRRRVRLPELWRHLYALEPELLTAAEKRARLAHLLEYLATQGLVELPRGRGSFERDAQPPLPRFVLVCGERGSRNDGSSAQARRFPWRPELAFAAALRLNPEELTLLRQVNEFLREGGAERPLVPAQERSLALFGDEKALERLARGRLFGSGRLSLALLRCEFDPPPFVWSEHGAGETLLVVENGASYRTLRRLLPTEGTVGMLAYGGGLAFINSLGSALELPRLPCRILYFGDLDPSGLNIPQQAATKAPALGLPPVEPALPLYRLLAEHGREGPSPESCTPERAASLAVWLGEQPLVERALHLLPRRRRLAQEAVGFELLQERGALLRGL